MQSMYGLQPNQMKEGFLEGAMPTLAIPANSVKRHEGWDIKSDFIST
jgi:hypothetical protein